MHLPAFLFTCLLSAGCSAPVVQTSNDVAPTRNVPIGNDKRTPDEPPTEPPADETPVRRAARLYLEKMGWTASKFLTTIDFELPERMQTPPFVHYQAACERVGLSLDVVAGKKLPLVKFDVGETARGSRLWAFVLVEGNEVRGAWLSTEAPVAPGIVPIDTRPEKIRW